MRAPKALRFTDDEEKAYYDAEKFRIRARIMELGVSKILETEYGGDDYIAIASLVLNDACGLRNEANLLQSAAKISQAKRYPPKPRSKKNRGSRI